MSKYDSKQIAKELTATAQGDSYYASALIAAWEMPQITANDKDCLSCYIYGTQTQQDRFRLHDIANYILSI